MVKKGYKQTEVGVIPEKWKDKKLGDVGKVCMCKRIFANQTSNTGEVPFFKIGTFGKEADAYISKGLYEDYKQRFSYPQKGDVLISAAGTLGRTIVFEGKDAYFQDSNIVWLDTDKELLCNEYLYHYYKVIKWGASEGSTIARLYNGIICNTHIALPDVEEQKQIATVLSELDELMSLTEKQIAKKKAIKQGAMQELLTGKRRLPGFSGEWETFVFGDLFDFIPNNAFTRAQLSDSGKVKNIHYGDILTKFGAYISADSNEIPYIEREIDLSRFAEKSYLQSGDIVIADTAEDETVGKALEVINVDCLVLAGQHTLLCRPKVRFSEKFLGYYLNAACYHDQLLPFIVGTKVSSISKASVAQTRLVVPKYKEQQAISCILSDMDDDITELEKKLAKYRQVKQGMMQQLLTGKIRLKNDVEDLRQAEQANAVKTLPARTAHNRQFDDAVSIAAIVDAFYSDKYPLGRVKVQKLLYLLHRHQAVSVSDFKKKAAGPYADTVRYKGGEPIAKKNKYIVSENGKQGTRYSRGENMAQALNYVERWGMQSDLQWLKDNFLHTGRNDLELFATVDMAICDLNEAGVPISVASIKDLIASSKEWKAKLSKTYFSDRDIARAIKKCTELFN